MNNYIETIENILFTNNSISNYYLDNSFFILNIIINDYEKIKILLNKNNYQKFILTTDIIYLLIDNDNDIILNLIYENRNNIEFEDDILTIINKMCKYSFKIKKKKNNEIFN